MDFLPNPTEIDVHICYSKMSSNDIRIITKHIYSFGFGLAN